MDKISEPKTDMKSEKSLKVMGFGERIKIASNNIGGASELSRQSGIPRNTLQRYISEETEPKINALVTISNLTSVSVEWLATGEGQRDQQGGDGQFSPDQITKASTALYGWLEKKKRYLKPSEFSEALLLICEISRDGDEVSIDIIDRLFKFKGV